MRDVKEDTKKIVRILLRVSSDQQLEADGDLSIQRQLVVEEVKKHEEWILDSKEYFEGSNSGYKNSVVDRDVLQEALRDAENKEYDILLAYKDDRLGRRMLEIPMYIMSLKQFGVDVYTVKDGLLTPDIGDVMGMLRLTMQYGMAEKSSSDTGIRVKDTAKKLVQQGKFMGGKAPYGYKLEYSGEYSKHQRALKHLVIVPEHAEVVKYIYKLSLYKEYGSGKIATTLNLDNRYKNLAPNDVWKSGTITSILTNPIYTGYTAYRRREHIGGRYRSLSQEDWIIAEKPNDEITIIDRDMWEKVQISRQKRSRKYQKQSWNEKATVISRNDGQLALIDVAYCGYCGRKLTNGTKYDYWTIKGTGERRSSQKSIYKCQNVWQGVPHEKMKQIRADKIEPIVFKKLSEYVGRLQEDENIFEQILENQSFEKKQQEQILVREKRKLQEIEKDMDILNDAIPKAITGTYPLPLEDLAKNIERQKDKAAKQKAVVDELEINIKNLSVSQEDWENLYHNLPTWQDIFMNADVATKRVLVNKLIERIDITDDTVVIHFKVDLDHFCSQPRETINERVSQSGL
ncbi:recombinase family protein [Coprococcus comes]|uniref:recombinase family protein n=1 Tax=Coprococcus comes TaxID=410072 RepID=UPI0018A0E1BC|nr:recombinase family protein [Coprococcus comes]MDC0798122.1 recombinase family protein [Coprococcus comes]